MGTTDVPPEFCCRWCGAEFHACETTFRGVCVQQPAAEIHDRLDDAA